MGHKTVYDVFLTSYLTAVKFKPQRDAVLPRLRSDPDKAGQDRLWDAIEDHLCGICIGMEHLSRQGHEQNEFNVDAEVFPPVGLWRLECSEQMSPTEDHREGK